MSVRTYCSAKYGTPRAEIISILADATEGFGTDHMGEVDCPTGYVQAVTLDESCDLDFSDPTNYPAGDLAGELAREYGIIGSDVLGHHIVTTDSLGFVHVQTFDLADTQDFQDMKDRISATAQAWYDSNEDQ